MTKRHPRRTDEEWMNLIQECRTSGLTDKRWCQEHDIHPSNFYYHIRRFREMACVIPESIASDSRTDMHEVVQISFDEPMRYQSERKPVVAQTSFDAAIRSSINGFQVELSNNAAHETILTTLSVLQRLDVRI